MEVIHMMSHGLRVPCHPHNLCILDLRDGSVIKRYDQKVPLEALAVTIYEKHVSGQLGKDIISDIDKDILLKSIVPSEKRSKYLFRHNWLTYDQWWDPRIQCLGPFVIAGWTLRMAPLAYAAFTQLNMVDRLERAGVEVTAQEFDAAVVFKAWDHDFSFPNESKESA